MSRRRMYFAWEMPTGVVDVVRAICADYTRRSVALTQDAIPEHVREVYARLNEAIEAALSDVEPGLRKTLLDDVGRHRGYDFSKISPYVAKNTYYNRKRKLVHDIARSLSLIE